MSSRGNKRKAGGMRYTRPVKSSYRSAKTNKSLRTSAFNPSPANVSQDDLLLKHMEAHYRRVTSAKGRTDTSFPESLLKCTKVQDHAKRHSDHMYNSNLPISGWSSSPSSPRTGRTGGVLKATPSHTSSKSDAGFVSMTASMDSLLMAEEELEGGDGLSTRNYYLPSNKKNVHLHGDLFASKRSSEHNLQWYSTSAIDQPERRLKYRNLLEFPVKEDTKWQLYHTKTGQLTGYLHYKQRSSPSRCPPSPVSVPTGPWKPAFSTNSTYSPSFSSPSKTTVLQISKGDSPPYRRKGKYRSGNTAELQPQDESSLGQTHILNKTIDIVSPTVLPAGTSMKIDPEHPLQTDLPEGYPLHGKPPAKESTSQEDHNTGEVDSDARTRTDERQTGRQGTQGIAATSASLPLAQREPSHVQTDKAFVVPADHDERGRELIDTIVELSLQAHAVDISSLNLRTRLMEGKRENEYLEFIAGVTRDIVARGVLSDSAMALLFKSHIERNKHRLRMDIMLEKVQSLKEELGPSS